jgi:hypothetical protein
VTTTDFPDTARSHQAERDEQDRRLDEMLADSFPASDPPSSWAGPTGVRSPATAALITAVVLLVAGLASPLDTTSTSPVTAYAWIAALASTPFAVALSTYELARIRLRPVG